MISSQVLRAFHEEMSKEAFLGSLASQVIRRSMGPGILQKDPEDDRKKALRDALLKGEAVEVRYQQDEGGSGPHYNNAGGKTYVSVRKEEDPGILAHELGHAEVDRTAFGKFLQSPALRGIATVGAVGGTMVGMMASSPAHRTIGTVIALASTTPILGAEGLASSHAIKKLRAAGATEGEVSAAKKRLTKAFGTYATVPAGILGDIATASLLSRL